MLLSVIVALGRNRVIGMNNVMPWHIPEDLRYFRKMTMGKPVVMGRNTLESIGGPLPGRKNVVVSRSGAFDHEGIIHATDIDEALSIAARIAKADAAEEIMIVGGGQIYEQVIGRADRLYLTEVDVEVDGHVYFPDYQEHGDWRETSRNSRAAAEARPAFDFVILERAGSRRSG